MDIVFKAYIIEDGRGIQGITRNRTEAIQTAKAAINGKIRVDVMDGYDFFLVQMLIVFKCGDCNYNFWKQLDLETREKIIDDLKKNA